jgi:hypothetical protein
MLHRLILVLLMTLAVAGCERDGADAKKEDTGKDVAQAKPESPMVKAIRLVYQEQEPGVEPYRTEVLITDDYMRIKDESDYNSFVLFDRKNAVVYSVSAENDTILVLNPKRNLIVDYDKHLVEKMVPDPDAPTISGKKGQEYTYSLDNDECIGSVVVADFLNDAADAYREYLLFLADQHKQNAETVPLESQAPCDVAINITEPLRHMGHGFPILEWNYTGYRRALVDYQLDYDVDPVVFELPKDMERFSLQQMQERASSSDMSTGQ